MVDEVTILTVALVSLTAALVALTITLAVLANRQWKSSQRLESLTTRLIAATDALRRLQIRPRLEVRQDDARNKFDLMAEFHCFVTNRGSGKAVKIKSSSESLFMFREESAPSPYHVIDV